MPITIANDFSLVEDARTGLVDAALPPNRDPFWMESSQPGVFVAGDVRYGSVKRVAAGVGEARLRCRLFISIWDPRRGDGISVIGLPETEWRCSGRRVGRRKAP
jgi:hypothetical protein